ncbi:ArdC-like ssDNA-binding domain-containing protein [Pedobacter sp. Leaf250]|uniref:ArdC-like ssDNA-binding domain-containing protein n=1 Tax=Pedobacter sp. Leaf250 TaxID=2876559 RepID=UPI001E3A575A|nr:ArdC-like ssDNA-binding domain-containing protein [Pedobacter sp. Leaf250]
MEAQDTTKELTPIQQKREILKALSLQVAPLIKIGTFENINSALVDAYKNEVHQEFKTFKQWKADGFFVKKGMKAFLIWGRPKRDQVEQEQVGEPLEDQSKFFPIAFLFSNAQVEKKGVSNG